MSTVYRLIFLVVLTFITGQSWGSTVIPQDGNYQYDEGHITANKKNYDYEDLSLWASGYQRSFESLSEKGHGRPSFALLGDFIVAKGGRSVGAMARREYQAASYHGKVGNAVKSKAPTNGQDALDMSVQVKGTSPRRVGIDYKTGEFAVFDQTSSGVFHGHVRGWNDLTSQMQNALRKSGMVDRRGNILGGGQ